MSLRDDERAQSIQIGAVLLFAVLIILFAFYQAFLVPSQNREVEFNHNQRVQGDMVEVRNELLSAKATGENGYAAVELGTEFPARLVGLNPSPPSGSLSSTARRPIVVEAGGSDVTDSVCPGSDVQTRFLEYSPTYAAYSGAGTIRYDNSLLYHDFDDGAFRMTGQQLVQGDTVTIVPIRGQYSEGGSQTVSVEPVPGLLDSSQRQDPRIVLPTRLSEAQWEAALEGEVPASEVSVTTGAGGQNLTLELSGEYTISCGPVGLGQAPPSGARGTDETEINPASPGDVRLVDETAQGNDQIVLTFNNTAGTNNFTAGRINFYQGPGNNQPTEANVSAVGESRSATMQIEGEFEEFSPKITLPGDGTRTDIVLEFDRGTNSNDWFVLTFELESGETALYFVPAG